MGQWYQHEGTLWLQPEYLPMKYVQRDNPHLPPPQQPSLTPEQQQEAITFVLNGMLRQVAKHFGTSYESIRRLMMKERISSPYQRTELTAEQEQEVRTLLSQGVSLRQIAKRFGVSHDMIWRIKREGEKEG